MGNGYKYNQQLQHHNSFNSSRNFLPLLCRLSLKDVKFPKWSSDTDRSSSSSSSSSSSDVDDPTSPKVSCIGQVKKRNNKLISCQITSTATAAPTAGTKSADNFKYTKLRKLFSGKNLLTTATVTTTAIETGHHHSCKIRSTKEQLMIRNGSSTGMRLRRPVPSPLPPPPPNVGELDPPLPVVKKVMQPGGDDSVNLWKRRNGFGNGNGNGIRLNGLQIQQIHVPANINLVLPAPTTV